MGGVYSIATNENSKLRISTKGMALQAPCTATVCSKPVSEDQNAVNVG